jgi:hypothetical protein
MEDADRTVSMAKVLSAQVLATQNEAREILIETETKIEEKKQTVQMLLVTLKPYREKMNVVGSAQNSLIAQAKMLNNERRMLFSRETEVKVCDVVKKSLCRQMRSQTRIIYDPKVDGKKSRHGWKIVVGGFGIGIRQNVVGRSLHSIEDVRYVLQRVDICAKHLRDQKLEEVAKLLEAVKEVTPDWEKYADDSLYIPIEPVNIIDHDGWRSKVLGFDLDYWGFRVVYERSSGFITRAHCDVSTEGGFLYYIQLESILPSVLADARKELDALRTMMGVPVGVPARDLEKFNSKELSRFFIEKVEERLGRWMLLGAL